MKAYLIQIDGWSGSTATPVYLASHDDDRLCHLNGQQWWPAIATLPTLRYDFFDGAFDAGSITSPTGSFTAAIGAIPNLPALALHDARIRIWRGELGDAWGAFTLLFDGRVKEQPAISDGIASFSIGTDDSWLDQPLLSTYAGTGGAEGSTDLQGQVKPLALGAPRFAPAVLVDAVDNIYQLSAYGAINGVPMAFDRLTRFGAAESNQASFAALKAAAVTRGRWATSLAGGYVKLGAPADGLLTFHVEGDAVGGWSRLPGALIARIAAIAGGTAKVASADITALNSARPWNLSLMVTAQTTARELIQRIAASVNAVAYVDWLGMLRVAPIGIGTASMTMAADGSALPPVASVEQVAIGTPYWKVAQGAVVTWQVHSLSDIAFTAPLNPRGPYDHAETYREGDMVTLANGSQWLFVGSNPASASSPSDSNPNWFRLSENITADNITYVDGTPMEDLKPAEPGATNGATPGQVEQIVAPSIILSRPTVTIWAYENGLVTDFANANGLLKVVSGGDDVTASATLSATATGCTGTINTATNTPVSGQPKGYYRVTALPGDSGKLTLTAVYGGKTVTAEFQLNKIRAGYEIVASTLPTANLFDGRRVFRESDGKLYTYKGGAWSATINGADIDNASLTSAKFASGIEPVTIVTDATLPTTKLTSVISFAGKLYRWNGSAYVATVPAADVTGKIVSTQIDDGSIQTPHLAARAATIEKLAIGTGANILPNSNLDTLDGWYAYGDTGYSVVPYSGTEGVGIRIKKGSGTGEAGLRMVGYATAIANCYLPVSAGETYRIKCKVTRKAGANLANVGLYTDRLFKDGTRSGSQIGGVSSDNPIGVTREVSGVYVVPSDVVGLAFQIYYGSIAGSENGDVVVTDLSVTRMAGGELIVDGGVLTSHLAADSVVAGKIAAAAVNTRELAAKAVVASRIAIAADNLITDAEYRDLGGYWTLSGEAFGATFGVAANQGSDVYGQDRCLTVRNVPAGASAWSLLLQGDVFPVKGGAEYFAAMGWWSNRTSYVWIRISYFSDAAATAWLGSIDISRFEYAAGWKDHTASLTAPLTARAARAEIYINRSYGTSGLVSDFNFGRFFCKEKNAGNLIVDGSILANHLAAGSVETDKLAAGAVVASKIQVSSLAAISATLGNVAVSGNLLVDGTVNGVKIGTGAVDTGNIATEAVTKSYFASLASPIISMPTLTNTQVLSVTLTGVAAGEVLRVSGMMRVTNPDDLEGDITLSYTLNGGAQVAIGSVCDYKIDSDGGASTKLAIPLFGRLIAPSAGTYVIRLLYYNRKSGADAGTGTSLDVMRQRR